MADEPLTTGEQATAGVLAGLLTVAMPILGVCFALAIAVERGASRVIGRGTAEFGQRAGRVSDRARQVRAERATLAAERRAAYREGRELPRDPRPHRFRRWLAGFAATGWLVAGAATRGGWRGARAAVRNFRDGFADDYRRHRPALENLRDYNGPPLSVADLRRWLNTGQLPPEATAPTPANPEEPAVAPPTAEATPTAPVSTSPEGPSTTGTPGTDSASPDEHQGVVDAINGTIPETNTSSTGGTVSDTMTAQAATDMQTNEDARNHFAALRAAAARGAEALVVLERSRNELEALAKTGADGLLAKKFDSGAQTAAASAADAIGNATLSGWAESLEAVDAEATAGLNSLEKYRDSENQVAEEQIDPSTLAATSS